MVERVKGEGIRIIGVEGQRAPETAEGPFGGLWRELGKVVAALEQCLVSCNVFRLALRRIGGVEAHVESIHDRTGNLVLDFEDIGHFAVKTLAPDMRLVGDVDELRCDPQLLARPADTSFKDGSDPQRLAHRAQVLLAAKAKRRRSRDHPQPGSRVRALMISSDKPSPK